MQKTKTASLLFKFRNRVALFKIITPILLVVLMSATLITPLYALTPARDLTGTWKSGVSGTYYSMDPSDGTMRMDDIAATFKMEITQQGNQISIVFYTYPTSYKTDSAYWNEYGMNGVPPVSGGDILFEGTVSGASFTADEYPASPSTNEQLSGTFTTDIITATLTGLLYSSDVNGIIVLREGSSATVSPIATITPTSTPTPAPAPPTTSSLARILHVQGTTNVVATGMPVTTDTPIGAGSEVQTGNDGLVGFDYPDNGGTVYLGANSDAGWVFLKPQTDALTGNIAYAVVPPPSGSYAFSEGIEPDEFGQAGLSLAAEVGVGLAIMAVTGAPITLGGALVVEGTLLLGSGIAYVHEQLSPQEGTYDVRPIQVPQGLVMGAGTDYVVTVSNGATIIQVMDGSVIFVDQYTNNSVTVQANQMLTLPAGVQAGFSQPDLQSHVSAFNTSSINQWWTQTAVEPTATPGAVTTETPATTPEKDNSKLLSSPMFLGGLIFVVIIVIAAILATVRSRKHSKQPSISKQKTGKQNAAQPATETTGIFCPSCGNQLLSTEGACPFCNADLGQWYPKTKK